MLDLTVHRKEMLIGKIPKPRHEGITEQIAQSKYMFCESMGIRAVLAEAQNGVVFEQAIEHIKRLARRAGDDARAEHRILIRGVRIYGGRPVVITQVPRIVGEEQ